MNNIVDNKFEAEDVYLLDKLIKFAYLLVEEMDANKNELINSIYCNEKIPLNNYKVKCGIIHPVDI